MAVTAGVCLFCFSLVFLSHACAKHFCDHTPYGCTLKKLFQFSAVSAGRQAQHLIHNTDDHPLLGGAAHWPAGTTTPMGEGVVVFTWL